MKYYISVFCLFLSFNLLAQNLEWAKSIGSSDGDSYDGIFVAKNNDIVSFGDYTNSIDLDPGNGVAMHSYSAGKNVFIQRLDENGNYIWGKSFENGLYGTVITDAAEDKYGNLYFTGTYLGTLDFDPDAGVFNMTAVSYQDCFILKLDSNGSFLWAVSIGGAGTEQGTSILVDENLNIYTGGLFNSSADFDPSSGVNTLTSNGDFDAFIHKMDSSRNLVWAHSYGGVFHDEVSELSFDSHGNIYVVGHFVGDIDFDFSSDVNMLDGYFDIYILKIDTNSSFKWVKHFSSTVFHFVTDMAVDKNDNLYLVGGFGSNNGNGGYIDFDPSNAIVNVFNSGEEDIFEVSLDAEGHFRWVNKLAGTHSERGHGVVVDDLGSVYFVGIHESSIDFDVSAGVDLVPGNPHEKLYLHAVDTNGAHKWVVSLGGNICSKPNVAIDNYGKLILNGTYRGVADFDPNSESVILPSYGLTDCFILKLNSFMVGVESVDGGGNLGFYPNPVSDVLFINSDREIESLEVFDVSGRKVLKIEHAVSEINVTNFPVGIYVMRLISHKKVFTRKFIKY